MLAWGYFLVQGVRDPLGGINSLWPLFGIANQLLATIALCVATTILMKMHGARYVWITVVPLVWLVIVTFTASYQKIFSPRAADRVPGAGQPACRRRSTQGPWRRPRVAEAQAVIFNARLDAVVCGIFVVLVATILVDSLRHVGRDPARDPAARRAGGAVRAVAPAPGGRMTWIRSVVRLTWRLLRELSDESAYERHLAHHGRPHSAEEWRRFSECRLKAKYQRARCC